MDDNFGENDGVYSENLVFGCNDNTWYGTPVARLRRYTPLDSDVDLVSSYTSEVVSLVRS